MDFRDRTITAPYIYLDGKFQAGTKLRVDAEGRIVAILKKEDEPSQEDLFDMEHLALLPGLVNTHSHAFHRYLRSRSQIGTLSANNFWKWRQNMYKLVECVDFEQMKKMCANTFCEMLSAGITTVGEFHYVHHADGQRDGRYALDLAVVQAAQEVGIRLVLIETLYMRAGFSEERVLPEQWRFASETTDEFIDHVEKMKAEIAKAKYNGLVSLALAIHSLRAVSIPDARRLFQFSQQHSLPLHIHLEEQPAELADCRAVNHGKSPVEVLLKDVIGQQQNLELLTAVHCTHTECKWLDDLTNRGATISICPSTEGYLGDGIPNLGAEHRLCLGTDCNNRIAMLEEMRWMAFCQNMRTNTRNCAGLDAAKLMQTATINGARSLGLQNHVGEFAIGKYLDFFAVDIRSPRLSEFINTAEGGKEEGDISGMIDAIVFGAGNAEILASGVAGQVRFSRKGTFSKH